MRKLITIILLFISFGLSAQMSIMGDTLEVTGGGSFGGGVKLINAVTIDSILTTVIDSDGAGVTSGAIVDYVALVAGWWASAGNYVYPTTIGDSIGINDATPSYPLDVNGQGRFIGNLYSNSLLTLGAAGKITTSGLILDGSDSLVDADAVYDADAILYDSVAAHRTEIDNNKDSITTHRTDINTAFSSVDATNISSVEFTTIGGSSVYESFGHVHAEYVLSTGTAITDNYVAVGTGTGIEGTSALQFDGSTMTITPGAADTALFIDQNNDAIGLTVNSEATTKIALYILGKYPANFTQDISNGTGLHVTRNIAEAGIESLATFTNDHASNTQPSVFINHDGTGGATGYPLHIDSENTAAVALKIESPFGEIGLTNGAVIDNIDTDTLGLTETVVKVSNILTADSVHANWYGGSDFELGETGSKITVDADSLVLTNEVGIQDGSFAAVTSNEVYDFVGGVKTYRLDKTVTTGQVATLGVTPVEILASPGAGSYYNVHSVTCKIILGTQLEVGAQTLQIGYNNGVSAITGVTNSALESIATNLQYCWLQGTAASTTIKDGDNFACVLSGGVNPSSGSVSLRITIYYTIETY